MQTRNFGLRGLTLALAGVLTLGLTACEDTDVIDPITPSSMTVSPATVGDLEVGDQVQLSANITHPASGATVTWASSNSGVASVNNGLVTAVAPGTATITATAPSNIAGATLQQSVFIRVVATDEPGEPTDPTEEASIGIERIVTPAGAIVDPDDVQGMIVVQMDVERGSADSLQVRLQNAAGNYVVCSQDFRTGAADVNAAVAAATVSCPINTARYNPETGEITYMNGPAVVTSRLFRGNDVIASVTSGSLTLRNQDRVVLSASVNNPDGDSVAVNPNTGQIWASGSVTATGRLISFSGQNAERASLSICASPAGCNARTVTEIEGNTFEVTWPKRAATGFSLNDVEDRVVQVFANNVLNAQGQAIPVTVDWAPNSFQVVSENTAPGQTGNALTFALDNRVPTANIVMANLAGMPANWINADFAFAENNTRIFPTAADRPVDTGVNAPTVTFYVRPASEVTGATLAAQGASIVSGGEVVTAGSDLAASEVSTAYRVAAVVSDLLGNSTTVTTANTFGTDFVAPTISWATGAVANQAQFGATNPPAGSWSVVVRDTTSAAGFGPNPVRARVTMLNATASTCFIGTGATCAPIATGTITPVPTFADANAYYTYEAYVIDQAGNRSETLTRRIVVDDIAPEVRNIILPASFTGGAAANVAGDFSDDLDLNFFDFRQRFGAGWGAGPVSLPFAAPQEFGQIFDNELVRSANRTATTPWVRAFMQYGVTGVQTPSEVGFRVSDAALNQVFSWRAVTTTAPTNFTADDNVAGWSIAAAPTTLSATTPSTVLTAQLTGTAADVDSPFAGGRVLFYMGCGGSDPHLIGEATGVETVSAPGANVANYTRSFTPTAGTHNVCAVGVTSAGDALGTTNTVSVTR